MDNNACSNEEKRHRPQSRGTAEKSQLQVLQTQMDINRFVRIQCVLRNLELVEGDILFIYCS